MNDNESKFNELSKLKFRVQIEIDKSADKAGSILGDKRGRSALPFAQGNVLQPPAAKKQATGPGLAQVLQSLETALRAIGYKLVDVQGDGNCQ